MNRFEFLNKQELINLIVAYDNYIYNGGELWNEDRQPVGIYEFFDNDYEEEN